ncbi:MAG: NADH:flavin oxidoreductase/NADH oxidase [Fimbriimonadaceae bacterium]
MDFNGLHGLRGTLAEGALALVNERMELGDGTEYGLACLSLPMKPVYGRWWTPLRGRFRFRCLHLQKGPSGRLPAPMASMFDPLTIRGLTLRNRIALAPMCMYSCEDCDGLAAPWHLVHLGARASGGAGLVMTEAAAIAPNGRISPQDLGIWSDAHAEALKPVAEFVQSQGAAAGVQLAHAGRKAGTYRPWSPVRGTVPLADGGWSDQIAPTGKAFKEGMNFPHEMSVSEIEDVVATFGACAQRAMGAGFSLVEIHAAHGYLVHQFLSPLSNERTDAYGGSFEGRTRFLRDIVSEVRRSVPHDAPVFVRISATDWAAGGWTIKDSVALCRLLAQLGVDLVDCSSGGATPDAEIPVGPGYQVELARRVRSEADVLTGAVGQITEAAQANEVVSSGSADLVFLGRQLLRDPYWPLHAASEIGAPPPWPDQYGWAVAR